MLQQVVSKSQIIPVNHPNPQYILYGEPILIQIADIAPTHTVGNDLIQ